MKKIVALVLSLVMVLGLATTAFAATGAYYGDTFTGTTAYGKHANCNTDLNTYSLEPYTAGAATAKTFDKVAIWETNKLTGAKTMVATYVVAASATSAESYFVDGTTITYLNYTAGQGTANAYAGNVVLLPTVDMDDVDACGQMFVKDDKAAYTDANGVFYVEDASGAFYNVDGKLVKLVKSAYANAVAPYSFTLTQFEAATVFGANTVCVIGHDYDCDYTTFNGDKTVTKVYCADCDANFAFVAGKVTDAVAKFGAGNYLPTALVDAAGTVYVGLAPVADAPAADAGEKVESAETFDAGIAMYVGMSVMAAAGSAVVLKKKD